MRLVGNKTRPRLPEDAFEPARPGRNPRVGLWLFGATWALSLVAAATVFLWRPPQPERQVAAPPGPPRSHEVPELRAEPLPDPGSRPTEPAAPASATRMLRGTDPQKVAEDHRLISGDPRRDRPGWVGAW